NQAESNFSPSGRTPQVGRTVGAVSPTHALPTTRGNRFRLADCFVDIATSLLVPFRLCVVPVRGNAVVRLGERPTWDGAHRATARAAHLLAGLLGADCQQSLTRHASEAVAFHERLPMSEPNPGARLAQPERLEEADEK